MKEEVHLYIIHAKGIDFHTESDISRVTANEPQKSNKENEDADATAQDGRKNGTLQSTLAGRSISSVSALQSTLPATSMMYNNQVSILLPSTFPVQIDKFPWVPLEQSFDAVIYLFIFVLRFFILLQPRQISYI